MLSIPRVFSALIFTAALVISGCNGEVSEPAGPIGGGGSGGGSGGSGGGTGGGATDDGGIGSVGTWSGGGGGEDAFPTFESDIVPIIQSSCGTGDNGCHSRVAYGANSAFDCRGWLTLEPEPLGSVFYAGDREGEATGCPDLSLYERLLTLDAWQCDAYDPRQRYVVPCEPENSYMMAKIDGGPYCRTADGEVTQPMPMGETMDPALIATIEAWILAGAPRDGEPRADCSGGSGGGGEMPTTGTAPVARISHPSSGETRAVGAPIPFIGEGNDAEDGALGGGAMVWESDVDGMLGTGREFSAPLVTPGTHVVTLTVTDSDGMTGTDTVTLEME